MFLCKYLWCPCSVQAKHRLRVMYSLCVLFDVFTWSANLQDLAIYCPNIFTVQLNCHINYSQIFGRSVFFSTYCCIYWFIVSRWFWKHPTFFKDQHPNHPRISWVWKHPTFEILLIFEASESTHQPIPESTQHLGAARHFVVALSIFVYAERIL